MSKHQTGDKNGQWKGGRVIASNAYVLIRVGAGHHLADVRGYAYEHRLVVEKTFGRRLKPGEQVHHKDGNHQNNNPDNLEITQDIASHRRLHRNAFTQFIADLIGSSPYTRSQLAEMTGEPACKVGWALTRLRKLGEAFQNNGGSWVGIRS